MNSPPEVLSAKIIVRGVHLELTPALRAFASEKAGRLLRRNQYIIRVRVDLEYDRTRGIGEQFLAKGHIEIGGPDLIASAASGDAYKSVDLLVDKLGGLLRRRQGVRKEIRHQPRVAEILSALPATD